MIIVDEFHPNLEKTTSTVLTIILSDLCIFVLNRDDTRIDPSFRHNRHFGFYLTMQ